MERKREKGVIEACELWALPGQLGNAVSQCGIVVSYDLRRLTNPSSVPLSLSLSLSLAFSVFPSIENSS